MMRLIIGFHNFGKTKKPIALTATDFFSTKTIQYNTKSGILSAQSGTIIWLKNIKILHVS